MDDPFELERFVAAQDDRNLYAQVLNELRQGRKKTHWMWFIFPQLVGLGSSAMAQRYAIASLAEARAYLSHEVLGARLRECAEAVARSRTESAEAFFGGIDEQKLRSSMTLFARADPEEQAFQAVLDRYFEGKEDPLSVGLLAAHDS